MRKTPVHQEQELFDAASIDVDPDKNVARAAKWANALWQKAHDGMGDTQEAAMYRAAERYGVEPNTFWALRYRKPKDILTSVYARLKAAYDHECGKQEARLRHELEITKALAPTPARLAAIAEAEAYLGGAKTPDDGASQ